MNTQEYYENMANWTQAKADYRLEEFYYSLYYDQISENFDPDEFDFTEFAMQEYGESEIYGQVYLGTVFSIMPSGKYWTWWASSNVDRIEEIKDAAFSRALEDVLHLHDMFLISGEGDPCNLFLCKWLDTDSTVDNIPDSINNEPVVFISDSQDTESLRADYPDYDSFFVCVDNGDYLAVWGMFGIVPYSTKSVDRLV